MSKVYLIPTTIGDSKIETVIPIDVLKKTIELRCFVVENIKTARRYLKKIDSQFPIDDSLFFVLNKHSEQFELEKFIVRNKHMEIGVISEAGCSSIADPGAEIISLAHKYEMKVIPFVGPSSILLALISSGFNGQQFQFNGYIPKDKIQRIKFILQMEKVVLNNGVTQIFMDTPYRNNQVVNELFNKLKPSTHLCIASNISCENEYIKMKCISKWKNIPDLKNKPTIFLIGNPVIKSFKNQY